MKWVFALSVCFIVYTCAGYPLWAFLKSRFRARPVLSRPIFPQISVVMAVHNEAESLPRKLENLLAMDYPADLREIIVVSDGSTDNTEEILKHYADRAVRALALPGHEGKASAISLGLASATGEIIVFTDARQQIELHAVRMLVSNFADPEVGCVSGELMLGDSRENLQRENMGLYWRFEKLIRQWEGASGSVVGATGAFYAARKSLLDPLPPGTILDDLYNPLQVCRWGKRVVFEPRARAWDEVFDSEREFRRKVRTLTGNFQLVQLAPWLLTRANPVRFEFISHKLLRLLLPFALIALGISSLAAPGTIYGLAVVLQLIFYGLALLTLARVHIGIFARLGNAALTFLVLSAAAAVALVCFLTGKDVWAR